MASAGADMLALDAGRVIAAVARIFAALGLDRRDAEIVANDLVAADLEGISSHGVMLVPLYVDRIFAGSVSLRSRGDVVRDRGGAVVIDGSHALGQLTARQAVRPAGD